jgi:hypothetical protein
VTVYVAALRTVPVGELVLVSVIGPVVASDGTVACTSVELMKVTLVAGMPLNLTVELGVKPTPVMSTTVPAGPLRGENPVIESVGVKSVELVPVPAAVVTAIGPATAPRETLTRSCIEESIVKFEAGTPPNVISLAPHRFVPVIVTGLPEIPDVGVNEPIVGAVCAVTV